MLGTNVEMLLTRKGRKASGAEFLPMERTFDSIMEWRGIQQQIHFSYHTRNINVWNLHNLGNCFNMLELFSCANFTVNIFQLSLHQYLMLNHFFSLSSDLAYVIQSFGSLLSLGNTENLSYFWKSMRCLITFWHTTRINCLFGHLFLM